MWTADPNYVCKRYILAKHSIALADAIYEFNIPRNIRVFIVAQVEKKCRHRHGVSHLYKTSDNLAAAGIARTQIPMRHTIIDIKDMLLVRMPGKSRPGYVPGKRWQVRF